MLRVNSELPDLYEDCIFGTVLVGNAGFLKFAKSYRVNYILIYDRNEIDIDLYHYI